MNVLQYTRIWGLEEFYYPYIQVSGNFPKQQSIEDMSKLKTIREFQNLTQEELAEKSGISVRTIQRIETGKAPKGYTLKVLAKVLAIAESELLFEKPEKENLEYLEEMDKTQEIVLINFTNLKLINLSSIPFIVIPPFNIIVPVLLMLKMKQKNRLTKQLISIQILWTIVAPIIFMLGVFLKLGNQFTPLIMVLIVLSNVFIILRNAVEIDKHKKLFYKLNFSMI
jgi:transcriptional regulator with XRE-family HTH domain